MFLFRTLKIFFTFLVFICGLALTVDEANALSKVCEESGQLSALRELEGGRNVEATHHQILGVSTNQIINRMTDPYSLSLMNTTLKGLVCKKIKNNFHLFEDSHWVRVDKGDLPTLAGGLAYLMTEASKNRKTFKRVHQYFFGLKDFGLKENSEEIREFFSDLQDDLRDRYGAIPIDPELFFSFYFKQYCSNQDLTKQRDLMATWAEIFEEQRRLLSKNCAHKISFLNRLSEGADHIRKKSSDWFNSFENWLNSEQPKDTIETP